MQQIINVKNERRLNNFRDFQLWQGKTRLISSYIMFFRSINIKYYAFLKKELNSKQKKSSFTFIFQNFVSRNYLFISISQRYIFYL